MLCQTHGRERSAEEYGKLLTVAGFEGIEACKTGSYLDVVRARKPLEPNRLLDEQGAEGLQEASGEELVG